LEQLKRRRAAPREIGEIKANDVRVRLIGVVISRTGDGDLIIDDGTGQARIVGDEIPEVPLKAVVKVIGRVVQEDPPEIYAEIVKDISNINREYYKKLVKLRREVGV